MADVYTVSWEIEIEAQSPEEAVQRAIVEQRDPCTQATFFTVTNTKTREIVGLNLSDKEDGRDV